MNIIIKYNNQFRRFGLEYTDIRLISFEKLLDFLCKLFGIHDNYFDIQVFCTNNEKKSTVNNQKDLESVIVKILANDDLLRLEIDPKNSNHKKSAIISVEFDKNFSKTITFLRNSKTEPLGFHIRKGLSTKSTSNCKLERFDGFFVSRIKKGHILTSRNDLLDINDEIVSIDKKPTAGKDLETIADEISQLVGNCEIKIIPYIYTDKVQNDSEDFQTNANLLIDKILAIPSTTTSMSDLDC